MAAALALAACLQDDGTRFNPLRFPRGVSIEREREIGYEFDRNIQPRLPFVEDLPTLEFVDELGESIVREIKTQPFVYRFRVIVAPTLNAFAVPGGYVYLHSGTILAAGSVDELAGVVAHEIGHVKGRHHARLQERSALPDLLTGLAAIAVSAATGEPAPAIVAQGANVALKLRFTREFEAEADRLAATFMARAGYDPQGLARFFERLVATEQRTPIRVPPYLYSHPDVEERRTTASELADELRPVRQFPPELSQALRETQARLALLVETNRSSWSATAPADRERTDPLLELAEERAAARDRTGALAALRRAAELEPNDPRVAFRRAELLEEAGRGGEAIDAYRRTLQLDPSRALVFYRLGVAYKAAGDTARAVFYLEQAVRRAAPGGDLRQKAEREVVKLTFPIVEEGGVADGSGSRAADTIGGVSRDAFGPKDRQAVWWARLGRRYVDEAEKVRVRWIDPAGTVVRDEEAARRRRVFVLSELALQDGTPLRAGRWTVEARLDDEVVDRRTFRLTR